MALEISSIPQGVLAVELDGHGLSSTLDLMMAQEPGDITVLGAVRYLFHKKLWDSTQPQAPSVLNKFYGPVLDRPEALTPEQYRTVTAEAIRTDYRYEMPEFVPYVAPPREERPQRDFSKPKKPRKQVAVERHETRDGVHEVTDLRQDVDTQGASERLKKVIGIQRGG
jgi:hypothetical protein